MIFDHRVRSRLVVKWGLRLLSWLLLYAGNYALFRPLLASRQETIYCIMLYFRLDDILRYLLVHIGLYLYHHCGRLLIWAEVVLDILPFLGPYISSGAGWVIGLLVFLVTAVLATLVISVAFLRYHPLVGLTYMAGAVTARTHHSLRPRINQHR